LAKPLVPISGRPLISYLVQALQKIGVQNLYVVVGADGDRLAAALRPQIPPAMRLDAISNRAWQKQNGISVLCAAGKVKEPFFLAMGDHLFDGSVLDRIVEKADRSELNLAIDRKIKTIFDLDDAMKVQTDADRVIAIGKDLANYDAIDTGVFLCPNELF